MLFANEFYIICYACQCCGTIKLSPPLFAQVKEPNPTEVDDEVLGIFF
jgi:hypothetical protein